MAETIEVRQMPDDDFDTLFGGESSTTPKEEKEEIPAPKKKLENLEKEEEGEENQADSEKDDKNPKTEISEDDEEILFPSEDSEEDSEENSSTGNKKVNKKPSSKDVAKSIDYKAVVDYMVESGKWADFEGREELEEIDEEGFLQIQEQQDDYRVQSKFSEKLDKVGEVGKAILKYEENGGNPEDLIAAYRERRDLSSVDLEDVDNQEEIIRAYYENQGEDSDWIDDYIETVKDKGLDVLKKDAEKKHSKLLELNKAEIAEMQKNQEEFKRNQEENRKAFETNIRTAIHKNEELSNAEKKDIEKFLLKYDVKLKDGRVVNSFFAKMLEIQADPLKYIELAKFVQNIDKYKEKVQTKTKNETLKKTWKFLKESEKELGGKGSILPDETKAKRKDPFSLTFKN